MPWTPDSLTTQLRSWQYDYLVNLDPAATGDAALWVVPETGHRWKAIARWLHRYQVQEVAMFRGKVPEGASVDELRKAKPERVVELTYATKDRDMSANDKELTQAAIQAMGDAIKTLAEQQGQVINKLLGMLQEERDNSDSDESGLAIPPELLKLFTAKLSKD